MAGRALAFSDPEIIRLATERFVPAVGDDWYERRRQDAQGRFFRSVSDQAGRGSRGPHGGSTRQAIYCLTPRGRLLACKNAGQLPEEMRKTLRAALDAWDRLPESEHRPGAITVESLKPDPRYDRVLPAGGLVLNVYTRALERVGQDQFRPDELKVNGCPHGPQHDHLWLTAAEWQALIPAHPRVGDQVPVAAPVARRIFLFHLVDSTVGEPVAWTPEQVRSGVLTLTVEEAGPARIRLRLDGQALLATSADPARARRGYDVRLLGYVSYDVDRKAIDRFDMVALGDAWGKNPIYGEGRPRRAPLGVAFELARGDSPADRVPPQGARWLPGYLDPGR